MVSSKLNEKNYPNGYHVVIDTRWSICQTHTQ